MSDLSSFSEDTQETLVSLPFKAGIFVSYAEDEEGEDDDARETSALEKALRHYAKGEEGVETLLKEIAASAIARKADWSRWADDVMRVEAQCEKAVQILKSNASEAEVKAYIRMVLDIMTRVAQAYGEFGMPEEKPKGFMGLLKKIVGGNADTDQPMNVSAAEDDTITRVTKALKKYA